MDSIKTKIFLTIIIPIILIVGFMGYLSCLYLQKLGAFPSKILSRNYKSIQALKEMQRALDNQFTIFNSHDYIDNKSVNKLKKYENIFIVNLNRGKANITEKGEGSLIKEIEKEYKLFFSKTGLEKEIDNFKNNNASFLKRNINKKYEKLSKLIKRTSWLNEKAMYETGKNTKKMSRRVSIYLIILTIMVIIISIFPSYIFASQISSQIDKLFSDLKKHEEEKINFMSSLSHQLKTPLTSLIMGISLLKDKAISKLDVNEIELISTVRDDTIRLASLTNELLETSNWEYFKMKFDIEEIEINEMIESSISPLSLQLESKKISLKLNIDKKLPKITVDPIKFPWVITNLVGNALRYTFEGGEIGISVSKKDEKIIFTVSDNGCGIDETYLKNIFDRYHPFSKDVKQKKISMGLPIVKEIVKSHNGDINVSSRVGQGTTFTFWIPIQYSENYNK